MRRLLVAVSLIAIAAPALAQSGAALMDRLSRLERDVNFLQRQVYAGGPPTGDPNALPLDNAGAAAIQVRLTQIDEEMRQLRGQIEQAAHQSREALEAQKRLAEDVNYRLQALEQAQAQAAVAAAGETANAPAAPTEEPSAPTEPAGYKPTRAAKTSPTGADFPNSNAHYNHAFKLLNSKHYSEAATSFDAFVRSYPNDPLVSNAYYWLGESYYARGDYTRAAEGFRKGFEANPQGQKAPDNLLKLAMSLENIKRTNEACIVLNQIVNKYGDRAPRTRQRAEAERSRMQCK